MMIGMTLIILGICLMRGVMSKEKLKPCPFCGGEAEVTKGEITNVYIVGCADKEPFSGCPVRSFTFPTKTKQQAISAWNTRRVG